jgi:outer membrane lipoprotein-sorting protein
MLSCIIKKLTFLKLIPDIFMKRLVIFLMCIVSIPNNLFSQNSNALLDRVKNKLSLVNNYEANAIMKTDVSFLKVPQANVKVYFKKPNKIKIKNEEGISFVPKGAVTINLNSIVSGNNFTVIDAGNSNVNGIDVKVLKLLPGNEADNIILSTIYVDEKNAVIIKAITTTKDNGTYELDMKYGRFIDYGLPDEVVFIFNTKDYKMPKGLTFDYDDASAQKNIEDKNKDKHGKIEIDYSSYVINKGVSDEIFK